MSKSGLFLMGLRKNRVFLRGASCRHFDLFFLGGKFRVTSSTGGGGCGYKMEWP